MHYDCEEPGDRRGIPTIRIGDDRAIAFEARSASGARDAKR
jgi:hypothetical protein